MRRLDYFEERSVTSYDGLKIYYEVAGEGKTALVFVHGLGGDVAAWDEERVYFQKLGYKTIALDLRGHGFSAHPRQRSGFTLSAYARDIQAVIEKEALQQFFLIGHCFGGMVVYTFEDLYSNQANGIVLIDASYRAPYFQQNSLVRHALKKFLPVMAGISPGQSLPRHVDYSGKHYERDFEPFGLWGVLIHNSLKTYLSATEAIFSLEVIDVLKKITTPTLIVTGTDDSIFPAKIAEEMHQLLKSSKLVKIERANHPVVLNRPMELSLVINHFLKEQKGN